MLPRRERTKDGIGSGEKEEDKRKSRRGRGERYMVKSTRKPRGHLRLILWLFTKKIGTGEKE